MRRFFLILQLRSILTQLLLPVFQEQVNYSLKIDDVDFTKYDVIFVAGGWGAAYDLSYSGVLDKKISETYYTGKTIFGSGSNSILLLATTCTSEEEVSFMIEKQINNQEAPEYIHDKEGIERI